MNTSELSAAIRNKVGQDPLKFAKLYWPENEFYKEQREIIYAMRDADEVFAPAGHQLGKDYVSGYVALSFFLYPQMYFPIEYVKEIEGYRSELNPYPHNVRVLTTSIADHHLRVLWGEIGRFIDQSRIPLNSRKGGNLIVKHNDIRKLLPNRSSCKISYLQGKVSEKGEGFTGHHAAYTLLVIDEASGIENLVYERSDTWAKRKLIIGNPYPCIGGKESFFYKGVKGGDLLARIA